MVKCEQAWLQEQNYYYNSLTCCIPTEGHILLSNEMFFWEGMVFNVEYMLCIDVLFLFLYHLDKGNTIKQMRACGKNLCFHVVSHTVFMQKWRKF